MGGRWMRGKSRRERAGKSPRRGVSAQAGRGDQYRVERQARAGQRFKLVRGGMTLCEATDRLAEMVHKAREPGAAFNRTLGVVRVVKPCGVVLETRDLDAVARAEEVARAGVK